jgi:hypothetical protein
MKNNLRGVFVILGIMLCALAIVYPAGAYGDDKDRPKIVDRDALAYGRSYAEWSAAWNQWADSIPVTQHPLFDNGDCSTEQSGPVWFLGGKFCAVGATCSYTAIRSCTVPAGKSLFFPIADFEDSALEENVSIHPGDSTYQQIATLRNVVSSLEGVTDIFFQIDHQPIRQLQKYGVYSVAFGFTLPADNLFSAVYPPPNNYYQEGTYFPGVDFGYYIMLQPLTPGNHTLHFGASWLDITYNLTVK